MKYRRDRKEYDDLEEKNLALYGMHAKRSRGREFSEEEHDWRSAFMRDRARIIHCKAFRRLEYKTQVFVNHEGDHYRTRLTHSLEVAQIARTVSRILQLNEDLAETISLAHDLGHTPFGHSGEERMNELMKGHGGFEHNRQSLRVVTVLESVYPEFNGLNLTYEVRDGISKHFTDYDNKGLKTDGHYTLEAEVVNLADEIAYNNHDLDDGLRSEMLSFKQLSEVEIWQEQYEAIKRQAPHPSNERPESVRYQTVRRLINLLVTDLVENTAKNLENNHVESHDQIVGRSQDLVKFSAEIKRKNTDLKRFLFKNLYQHYRVVRMADKAQRMLSDLFQAYQQNTKILPPHVQQSCEKEGKHRAICDYIAGMTDRFALDEHSKLFNPRENI